MDGPDATDFGSASFGPWGSLSRPERLDRTGPDEQTIQTAAMMRSRYLLLAGVGSRQNPHSHRAFLLARETLRRTGGQV